MIPEIGIKAYHRSFHPILNEFYAMHIRICGFVDFWIFLGLKKMHMHLSSFQAFGVLVD